jgi:hypothetical protein
MAALPGSIAQPRPMASSADHQSRRMYHERGIAKPTSLTACNLTGAGVAAAQTRRRTGHRTNSRCRGGGGTHRDRRSARGPTA